MVITMGSSGSGLRGLEFCQGRQDNSAQLLSQTRQGTTLGFQDLLLVGFEPRLGISKPLDHHPPEQLRQFACQCDVRYQSATPCGHPSIETTQGDIFALCQATRHHAEQPPGPIAFAAHRAFTLPALVTPWCQAQPGGKVLLSWPTAQVGAHLSDQLEQAIIGVRWQHSQILAPAQLEQYMVQVFNLRCVDTTTLESRGFDFRSASSIGSADLAQHDVDLLLTGRDSPLIML